MLKELIISSLNSVFEFWREHFRLIAVSEYLCNLAKPVCKIALAFTKPPYPRYR